MFNESGNDKITNTMKKSLLLGSLVVFLASFLPAKSTEYIYAGSFALIGDYAYTVEVNGDSNSLIKYSFPAFEEAKRVELNQSFPNILGSEKGFAVSSSTSYEWSDASESDKATIKKRKSSDESFAPANNQTLTETTVYTSYNSDLEKVGEKTITNVYVFSYVYEDDPTTLADDGLAGAVDEKFCGKKKSKHGKCKKVLLRTH